MHKHVEMLIGRLATDEEFRRAFRRDPRGTLAGPCGRELVLTPSEVEAVLATEPATWDTLAAHLDARLQKVSLRHDDDRDL